MRENQNLCTKENQKNKTGIKIKSNLKPRGTNSRRQVRKRVESREWSEKQQAWVNIAIYKRFVLQSRLEEKVMKIMQTFNQVVEEFGLRIDSETIFDEAERQFLLKPFKLKKFSIRKLVINYAELTKKYQNGQIQVWNDEWHKNQRKLFIQFLVCFCKLHGTSPENIMKSEWEQLSKIFFGKNPMFLKFQGLSIMKNTRKISWDENDDDLIRESVRTFGQRNWNQISKGVFFSTNCVKYFSPKQIRERWFNHISENINRGDWSLEEDLVILEHVAGRNRHWCEIVKLLENTRTEHMIKNRYKFLIRMPYNCRPAKEHRIVNQTLNKIRKKLRNLGASSKAQISTQNYTKIPVNSENDRAIYGQPGDSSIKLKEDSLADPEQEAADQQGHGVAGLSQEEFISCAYPVSFMGVFLPYSMSNSYLPSPSPYLETAQSYSQSPQIVLTPGPQEIPQMSYPQENSNSYSLKFWPSNMQVLSCYPVPPSAGQGLYFS